MYVDQRHLGDVVILDCCGRFDETDHSNFMNQIENLQGQGLTTVVLNLTSLYFLDPKVISLLHFAHEFLQSSGGSLSLVSPLSAVQNELNLANIPDSIPTYPTLYDALHRPYTFDKKNTPVAETALA
ncbi:MAG: STAS domain-containing protein [Nitrospirales bacterium]|nr:STAS domain-containing protein [Nitrospira sp.]MDR4500802.1 STAS domain-containing protein [Nitrospirales bacterium]